MTLWPIVRLFGASKLLFTVFPNLVNINSKLVLTWFYADETPITNLTRIMHHHQVLPCMFHGGDVVARLAR